jgi:hypothetical protein
VTEDVFEIVEAEQSNLSLPEQGVAWLKCGLGFTDDAQVITITPSEIAEGILDALLPHARNVRDAGTGRIGEAQQLEQIGMGRENRR